MNFFISDAWAQAAPAGGSPDLMGFLPLILIFVVFYFLLIRPQSKRQKEHKKMLAQIEIGDEVITNGGLFGIVSDLQGLRKDPLIHASRTGPWHAQ